MRGSAVPAPDLPAGRRPAARDGGSGRPSGARTGSVRPDNSHAKAGNINHALERTSGELIFCLDADHVPLPDALDAIVGYFDDDKMALVQSPHDFYNQDSVQHYEPGRHEQSLFFEVVCPGKDRHNGVFWCGSAALLRRSALVGVGGVATETIAEDFHSTIKLHRAGWTTRYHDEVLVQGIAPHDLDGYLLQRDRWARGNLAVLEPAGVPPRSALRSHAPPEALLLRQPLRLRRRRVATAHDRRDLVAVAGLGVLPAHMTVMSLAVLWAPWTVLAIISASALCRGHLRSAESSHYTLITAAIFTRALRCAILPSRTKFKVTPKAGVDAGGLRALRAVRPLIVVGVTLAGALVWRGLGLLGYVHVRPLPAWAATFAMVLRHVGAVPVDVASLRTVFRRRQQALTGPLRLPRPGRDRRRGSASAPSGGSSTSRSRASGCWSPKRSLPGRVLQVDFALPGLDGRLLAGGGHGRGAIGRPARRAGGGWARRSRHGQRLHGTTSCATATSCTPASGSRESRLEESRCRRSSR